MKIDISDEDGRIPIGDLNIFNKMTDEEAYAVFGESLKTQAEIPDEIPEQAGIDPKKMSPDQIKEAYNRLVVKGLIKAESNESHEGLVKKKVTVKRGGKTFEQERWVKAGEDEPVDKPKKGEEEPGEKPTAEPKPEKPKGPVIIGLNKPEGEDGESEKSTKTGLPHSESFLLKDTVTTVEAATQAVIDGGWVFDTESDIFPDMEDYDSKRTPINVYTNAEGELYGMCQFSIGDFGNDENTAEIEYLEINTPMRGKGYGRELMRNIIKTLSDKNCDNVILASLDENSNKFYEAIGMIRESNTTNIYKGDREWMTKTMKNT